MRTVIIVNSGLSETLSTMVVERLAATRTVLVVGNREPRLTMAASAMDELPELLERFPQLFAAELREISHLAADGRPRSFPWWTLHDVPVLLEAPPQIEVPRRAVRPVRQPGLSGKRTRRSQKLHNRRAA